MKIFVSYSRRDAGDFANQINRHLSSKHDIFTDVYSIRAGEVWSNIIEKNISNCDIFVVIVTDGALHSPHVENEVLQAQKENKKIIPCFHKNVSKDDIKWELTKIQGIEFTNVFQLARDLYSKINIETNINRSRISRKSQLKIFISYSRRDAGDFAMHIYRYLSGFDNYVFIDIDSIRIGEPWTNSIYENISICDIFIIILTPGSLTSPRVEDEVLCAQRENKIIVPCINEEVEYSEIKWGLDKIQCIKFSDKEKLVRTLYSKIRNYKNIENEKQNNHNINLEQDNLGSIQKSDFDNLIIDEHSLDHPNLLKEPSISEIEQIIYEIESSNNEEKEHKFNELENLARYKRLYNNEKILAICDKYILSNNDYSLLSRVLDFVKRLLSTSINIDKSNYFLNYVRSKYSEKFREIILSTEKEYRDAQNYVRQILEWYRVFDDDNINKLYWQSIKNHIEVEDLELSKFLQCINSYFNKIKQSDDFKQKCRSEIFEMTKLNNNKIKQRAELLMKLFQN